MVPVLRPAHLGGPGREALDLGEDEVAELRVSGPLLLALGSPLSGGSHWAARPRAALLPSVRPHPAAEGTPAGPRGGNPNQRKRDEP